MAAASAVLLGLAGGIFGGMFGVGGGLVMVPVMVVLMSVPQHRAHATSLAAIVASSAAAVTPLAVAGKVHWGVAAILLLGAVVGASVGAGAIARVSEIWLARAFVVLVLVAAARMLLQGADAPPGSGMAGGIGLLEGCGLALVGLAAGSVASMLGVGGGIVFVPALVTLFGFAQHEAQATSLAVIVPTAAVAAWVHARAGRVDWPKAIGLGAGGLAGGALGAWSALAVDGLILRRLFAVILVAMAYRMLRKARPHLPVAI